MIAAVVVAAPARAEISPQYELKNAIEWLGSSVVAAEIDEVYGEWQCSRSDAAPWDTLRTPTSNGPSEMEFCFRSTESGWAVHGTNAQDDHYCVTSDDPERALAVDEREACKPPGYVAATEAEPADDE